MPATTHRCVAMKCLASNHFALVVCLLVVAAAGRACGSRTLSAAHMNTYIVNHSTKDLVGTTSYKNFLYCDAKSKFVNRPIPAGKSDHDEYCTQSQNENVVLQPGGAGGAQESHLGTMDLGTAPQIGLELWIKGASQHGNTAIPPDESVIATDAPNGGVDIFLAKYGDLSAKKDANESPLVTLRP